MSVSPDKVLRDIDSSPRQRSHRSTALSLDATNLTIAFGQPQTQALPNLGESLYRRARALHQDGQLDQALALLQQLPQASFEATMLEAELLSLKGSFSQARSAYEALQVQIETSLSLSAAERTRMRGLVRLNTAWLLEQSGELEAALQRYSQSIESLESLLPDQDILPALMMAYRQRARAFRQLGRIPEALEDLQRSASRQEQLLKPLIDTSALFSEWFALAQQQFELQQWHNALQSYEQALKLRPHAPTQDPVPWTAQILTQQARCLEQVGQSELAVQLYTQALVQLSMERFPRQWVLVQLLSTALRLRRGDTPDSITFAQIQTVLIALEQSGTPRQELAVPLLALAELSQLGDADGALELYGAAIRSLEQAGTVSQRDSQRLLVEAYRGRAGLLESLGQLPKALASFSQAQRHAGMALDPAERAELELQHGLLLQAAHKPELALAAFARAQTLTQAETSPESVWFRATYFQAFLCATGLQRPADALELLLQLDQLCPGHVDYDLACIYARLGQEQAAFTRLQQHLAGPAPLSQNEVLIDEDLAPLQQHPTWQQLWTN
ncbi:MAG: hypothetical protein CVV27_00625 [Candidatus Melainabacteria bacterium HGW-Melainabacteria-1]|nr:MAG: hypothetical protein CVV27_00625 [Candidatus Melainabacteria bacterium HGW-Melainabacteria-1]